MGAGLHQQWQVHPACNYGINPRFMVNMACIAAKAKLGDAEVRRAAHRYLNTMSRGTRVISRLQPAPDVVARLNPRGARQ